MDNREIRPGRSEYGFSFRFPVGLPQSFKSDHGKVEYWAEVAYPKSWAPDHRIRLDLNVSIMQKKHLQIIQLINLTKFF